ncbi:MAG: DUF3592 domain-containing protein [Planctomycetes bacterium]|nr:DUF3592 domain-containing protein [Planctomycetota bacterium]
MNTLLSSNKKRSKSMMDIVMKVIFVGGALGLGLMLLIVGVREFILQRQSLTGVVPIEAVIVSANVVKSVSADTDPRLMRSTSTTSFSPEVKFRYTVDGKGYESDMLRPTVIGRGFASDEAAREEIAAFIPGSVVQAYVNPELPSRGFLIAERSSAPVVFMIVGTLLMPIAGVLFKFL